MFALEVLDIVKMWMDTKYLYSLMKLDSILNELTKKVPLWMWSLAGTNISHSKCD